MKESIVMSGGGAKGAFQVGVLWELLGGSNPAKPSALYGTSVGALNATGLAFLGIVGLHKVWMDIRNDKDIIKGGGPFRILKALLKRGRGAYSTKPLRAKIEGIVNGKTPAMKAVACRVSLTSGAIDYVESTPQNPNHAAFIDAVHASASIPIIMDTVHEWVDGGVREVAPLKRAIDEGAERIYVIMANPSRENPDYHGRVGGLINIAKRTIEIMCHEIIVNDLRTCHRYNCKAGALGKRVVEVIVYAPPILLLDTLDFKPDRIRAAIQQGREEVARGPVFKTP